MIGLRIGGCRLEFHFGFAAAAAFLLLADRSGIGIAGAAAAILHELGHLVCMKWLEYPPCALSAAFSAWKSWRKSGPVKGTWQMYALPLAGPCANAAAFFLLLPIQWLFPSELVSRLLGVNAVLAAFHLLPVEPLDGGQALYAALCRRLPVSTAERLTSAISFLTLLPLGILGFLVLLRSHYNFTLLLVSGYLMLMMLLNGAGIIEGKLPEKIVPWFGRGRFFMLPAPSAAGSLPAWLRLRCLRRSTR